MIKLNIFYFHFTEKLRRTEIEFQNNVKICLRVNI